MKIRFIVNPRAGRGRASAIMADRIESFVAERKLNAEIVRTEYPRHAIPLAAEAVEREFDLVVACGGDGTVNEVAQSLVGTNVDFGILPCGSGNGLARHLKIPRNPEAALELLLSGQTRAIDTGLASGRPFVNVMGIGFDALISDRFNRLTRRGLLSYIGVAALAFFTYTPLRYEISIDGGSRHVRAWLVAVANSSQYGNDAFIAPGAEVDDGRFNLVTLAPHRIWHVPSLAFRLFRRTLDRHSRITTVSGSHFVIRRKAPGLIHTDGEPHRAGAEIEVKMFESSLRIKVPPPHLPVTSHLQIRNKRGTHEHLNDKNRSLRTVSKLRKYSPL